MGVRTVRDVIGQLGSGGVDLAAAVADFRARDWSAPALSPACLLLGEDTVPPVNDWAIVEQARQDGRITPAQYMALRSAVVDREARHG